MSKYRPTREYTPEYKKWIYDVFKRDGFKCLLCGSRKFIQAHHLIRYADHAEARLDVSNGATLCEEHHKMVDRNEYTYLPRLKEIITGVKQDTIEDILAKYEDDQ